MSDSTPAAAEAATNNPTAATQIETPVEAKTEQKTEAATDSKDVKGEAAIEVAEKEKKTEESSDKRGGRDDYRRNGGQRNGRNNYSKPAYKPRRANNTTEFDNLPESDNAVEIRTQVEFYFADHNLSTDEFLFKMCEGPKNTPVPIKQLHSFKRMRHFQPYSAVVEALRESEVLEVVDDGSFSGTGNEGVKRKVALSTPSKDSDEKYPPSLEELYSRSSKASLYSALGRSAYVKGFNGEEDKENVKDVSQLELEMFFKAYGCVAVRKRRDETGKYKGSVFVEFDNQESQEQFLALDPKPKFNGHELVTMGKKEYNEMKCKEKGITPGNNGGSRSERNDRNDRQRGRGGQRGRGRGRGRGGDRRDGRGRRDRSRSRDSNDSRDWNRRRDNFQKSRGRDGDKRDRSEERKPMEIARDADGVPVIKDTRTEEASKKRKADADVDEGSKKSKLKIVEDE